MEVELIGLREPRLIQRVEHLASAQMRPVEEVLEAAVQTYLDKLEREGIHAETQAFWDMRDELLREYPGQHVALYRGEVVDHDKDASRLARRVRERFGWLPVLIAPLKPRRELRWLGGRLEAVQ